MYSRNFKICALKSFNEVWYN